MILEVCANSFKSAKNAAQAGTHRIELCTELALGGITPSHGLLAQVIKKIDCPVFVLIRPRSGNFVFSNAEFKIMLKNIKHAKKMGCKGIVSGVLHSNNQIDLARTKQLIQAALPLPFTFHRAFDCVPNPIKAYSNLKHIGVNRILSSGQHQTAEQGITLLNTLKTISNNTPIILPGAGIHAKNAKLFKHNGFTEIHASASTTITSTNTFNNTKTQPLTYSSKKKIKALLKAIS